MCGISGIVSRNSNVNEQALLQMNRVMRHRGPDGSGVWLSDCKKIGLGHVRLAIIDLTERGHQPFTDTTGQYQITFNGEIYNYKELKAELKSKNISFKSDSDTEVILESYKHWGKECVSRFNGMFAFVIYDIGSDKIFAARDRYGEKPFLFVFTDGIFCFASEYKALLQLREIGDSINEIKIIQSAYNPSAGMDAGRQTVFNSIQQLQSSEALSLDIKTWTVSIEKYWDILPKHKPYVKSFEDAAQEFRSIFVDSVKLRMRSDVPVGSCLSGGLDSSAIVGVVRQVLYPEGVYHTFTGSFPGSGADELPFAQLVIDSNRTTAHVVEPNAVDFSKELSDFVWFNELPVSSASQYAQYCVFRSAKANNVTVLLDGQGSDEILGGYEQYFRYYIDAVSHNNSKTSSIAGEIQEINKRYPLALQSQWKKKTAILPLKLRSFVANQFGKGSDVLFGVNPRYASSIKEDAKPETIDGLNKLNNILYQDSFSRFLTTLLRYGDRNSMAHATEVRLPFCDHRIAEFVMTLPPEYIMGNIQTKRLLREALKDLLPAKIYARWNKQGFRPPQEDWFKGSLLQQAQDIFNSKSFIENNYWNASWWQGCISRIKKGETHLGWNIWQPFIAENWKQSFYKRLQCQEKINATVQ